MIMPEIHRAGTCGRPRFCRFWRAVKPNDYKGQIAAAVKQSTGRDLNLGRIHLSVFPWVALELGPGSLGNRPGSGAEAFLVFDQAEVRVRLIPLLRKRLEVAGMRVTSGRVSYRGMVVENLTLETGAFGDQGVAP